MRRDSETGALDERPLLLIDGNCCAPASQQWMDSIDPAMGSAYAMVPEGGADEIAHAVAAARRAFETGPWARTPGSERGALLHRFAALIERDAERFARIEARDAGMPLTFARMTIATALGALRYYASLSANGLQGRADGSRPGEAGLHAYTRREPVGVVGIITPWNGPLVLLCIKLAAAIAAGCTCVIKPPELASISTLCLGPLFAEAGFPAGVVNIVTGPGSTAGDALAMHPGVDKISFTGSTRTGRRLIEAASFGFKRLTLELGGKSPMIIMPDADLQRAVPAAALSVFGNAGQMCIAASRLHVHASIYEQFLESLAAFTATLTVGDSLDENTTIGPLISEAQHARVTGFIERAQVDGAALVLQSPLESGPGYYAAPTILAGVDETMEIAREEVFGPVLAASAFEDLDDVIASSNRSPYGLAAGLFTRDLGLAHRTAAALRAGTVWVNGYGKLDPSMPFGGFRQSGWGREFGPGGLDAFLETKSVLVSL